MTNSLVLQPDVCRGHVLQNVVLQWDVEVSVEHMVHSRTSVLPTICTDKIDALSSLYLILVALQGRD